MGNSQIHLVHTKMDTAAKLPESTVAMLVESLSAYSVGDKPNAIETLTVFGGGGHLVGAIDVRNPKHPIAVSKEYAQLVVSTAEGLARTATLFRELMRYIKVSYDDKELLVIPGEQYNVAAVIESTVQ